MESLAQLVVILFMIVIFSGPVCLLLASPRIKSWSKKSLLLFWIRRVVVISLGIVGAFIAAQFLLTPGLSVGRLVGLFGAITVIVALKKEFDK